MSLVFKIEFLKFCYSELYEYKVNGLENAYYTGKFLI